MNCGCRLSHASRARQSKSRHDVDELAAGRRPTCRMAACAASRAGRRVRPGDHADRRARQSGTSIRNGCIAAGYARPPTCVEGRGHHGARAAEDRHLGVRERGHRHARSRHRAGCAVDASVVGAGERHARAIEPETAPVAAAVVGVGGDGLAHRVDQSSGGRTAPAVKAPPEAMHVRCGGVRAAVSGGDDRQVEDVAAPIILVARSPCSAAGRRSAGSRCRAIPAGSKTRCVTSWANGTAAHALGDQGQHDVAAVAVGESLAGGKLRRVAVEDRGMRAWNRAPAPAGRAERTRPRPRRGSRRSRIGGSGGGRS